MKKYCLLLLLLLFLFCLPVSAAEAPDCYTVPEDILSQMDLTDAQQVIQVPQIYLVQSFADHGSIEDILHNSEIKKTCYWVLGNKTLLRQYAIDEKGIPSPTELPDEWNETDHPIYKLIQELLSQSAIHRVSPDVQIKNRYVLQDIPFWQGNDGIVIYYETNMGDFVYHLYRDNQHLFPAEEFFTCMKKVRQGNQENAFLTGAPGWRFYKEYWRYDLDSQNFSLSRPVPAIVWVVIAYIPIAAAVGLGYLISRRRARKTE